MKSNLDQWNWRVVIAGRTLQFKSMKDNSINDVCRAIKWLAIKWITMSRKGTYFIVSKTHFYVMHKLYVEWPILTTWFLFLKAHIYIWIEINSVLGRKQSTRDTRSETLSLLLEVPVSGIFAESLGLHYQPLCLSQGNWSCLPSSRGRWWWCREATM